jgi:4-diphosphocytidyl-2-C-methyl-D-erythritol kinase
MRQIKLKARAKINISLDVLKRRNDGYHEVEMIMQTVNLYDQLVLRQIGQDKIMIKTNLPFLPTDERNLVYKVIAYMKEMYNIKTGVFVNLYKVIPVAAGLAGGSSDAGIAIIGMNKLFELGLDFKELLSIGSKFGADIPYCMIGGTAIARGIGADIEYLDDFPSCHVLIVKPKFSISTAFVYNNLCLDKVNKHPNTKLLVEAIKRGDLDTIGSNLCNVLESVTIKEYPQIREIKNILIKGGAVGSLMSGSGSSVFGLFKSKEDAINVANSLKLSNKAKYAYTTTIYNGRKG